MHYEMTKKMSLWILGISPLVWALHFLFSYVFAAIWCAKFAGQGGNLHIARVAIGVATMISFIIIGREIIRGHQMHRIPGAGNPHDDETPEDKERFLGMARLLISILSFVGISYTAYVAWFFRSCV